MAKNSRKKRRKQRDEQAAVPPPPRPSRARNRGTASRPEAVEASPVAVTTAGGEHPDGPGSERTAIRMIIGRLHELVRHLLDMPRMFFYVSWHALGVNDTGMRPAIGDVVEGTVVLVTSQGLIVAINGTRQFGRVFTRELHLSGSETPRHRYSIGDPIEALVTSEIRTGVSSHLSRIGQVRLVLSVRRNAPGYLEAQQRHAVGDVVSGTVTDIDGGLRLDVNGLVGDAPAWELDLADGESAQDRYAVGETIDGLFVWQVDHTTRRIVLSVKRNAPGYLEALRRHAVGEVVSATVTDFASNDGLWLDVDGLVGAVGPQELVLAEGESAQERYAVGQTIDGLSVKQINHKTRDLFLSVKRNAPGYVEALQRRAVGEVVSATVTGFPSDGGLWLDVDGLVGNIPPWDPDFADGESAQERYTIGETIHGLFVWQVSHEAHILGLSVKRNTPVYLEALRRHTVGEVVSATVTDFWGNGRGLWLDVNGLVGAVGPQELGLADGESAQERYAVGETIDGLFVWQVNHEAHILGLSVKRNATGYLEALERRAVGEVASGTITAFQSNDGLWLDVNGLVGAVGPRELDLADGESARERYAVGETIEGLFVWLVDQRSRFLLLSLRRKAPWAANAQIKRESIIEVVVRENRISGIDVSVIGSEDGDVFIPDYALSLAPGDRPRFGLGEAIHVFVTAVGREDNPPVLSRRRALEGWPDAVARLAPGVVVQDAQVIPSAAFLEGDSRAAVDLGPIIGYVSEMEVDAQKAAELMEHRANTSYPVLIEAVDERGGIAEVSEAKFAARWAELTANISVGESMEAELRRVARDKAILDLGSGLQAEMPREQIPTIEHAGERRRAREGDTFPVLIISKNETEHIIEAEHPNQWLVEMIAADENLKCEFKAIYRGPSPKRPPKQRYAREIRSGLPVLRAMAALMNQQGGYVLVGVEDTDKKEGGVIGWQASGFPNQNSLRTDLGLRVNDLMLTPKATRFYEASFNVLPTGEEVLAIKCDPAAVPVYVKNTLDDRYEFPLRRDAGTQVAWPLDEEEQMRELRRHFADRWPDEDPEALWSDFQRRVRTHPSEG